MKVSENEQIERAHELHDLINHSKETKRLYNFLIALLEQQSAVSRIFITEKNFEPIYTADGSAIVGQRAETVEEKHERFTDSCGFIRGLQELKLITDRLINLAVKDNLRKKEETDE